MTKFACRAMTALGVLSLAGAARAQSGNEPLPASQASTGQAEKDVQFELSTEPTFTFRSDLEDDKGDVEIYRQGLGASLSFDAGDRLRLTLKLDGEIARYDFGSITSIAGSTVEPFDDVYETGIGLRANYELDDSWSLIGNVFARAGFEGGADFGDSIWGGGGVAVGYTFSEAFFFAAGAGVSTRLDRQPIITPLVFFKWKINDKVTFATTGLGAKLTASLGDQVSVYLRGGYEYHQYRLEDDNASVPGGTVRDHRVPIGVGVEWRPVGGLTLALEGGAVIYQEYQLRDDDANKVDEFETDPAAYIGGRLSYRF